MIMKSDNMNGYVQLSQGQSYNASGRNQNSSFERSGPRFSRKSRVGMSMFRLRVNECGLCAISEQDFLGTTTQYNT